MEPSPELREIIVGWFEAAANGDVSVTPGHVSRQTGMRIVGTDPKEWLDGEQAYAFLKEEAEGVGGKIKVVISDAEAFTEGDVGWGVARPIITLLDGAQVSPRWSAVFHREEGQWKLVQLHASIGVSNEEAFGDVLPS